MAQSIYLINPRTDFPVYYGAEIYRHLGLPPAAFVADLTVTTVAALIPEDFTVEICDESITPVRLDHPADIVGLTGRTSQRGRMCELAREFRRRGKTVILGGPYATLSPEAVRPWCDVLVRGEIEDVAFRLFTDLREGTPQAEYVGSHPDLARSPGPRWDLYPTDRALQGSLQTSRGCPHNCDFCDTIQYVGRRQRHKPTAAILTELDALYARGFRTVFLADDNFTAHRSRARGILEALGEWNARARTGRVRFATQLSVDTADDTDLLTTCSTAGLNEAFVGIETPSPESLRECGKRQNLGGDLRARLEAFVGHGVGVIGGLIVGFDADTPEIFTRQYDFAMETPVPTFSVNALIAAPSTPLHARMEREGRLLADDDPEAAVTPWWTNFVPNQMSVDELRNGIRWLINRLYRPAAFETRMLRFIELYNDPTPPVRSPGGPRRAVNVEGISVVRRVARLGSDEARMFARVMGAARARPETERHVFANLFRYIQIRTMYEQAGFWDPKTGGEPVPPQS